MRNSKNWNYIIISILICLIIVTCNSFRNTSTKVENMQLEIERVEQATEELKKEVTEEPVEKPSKEVEKAKEIEEDLYSKEVFDATRIKHYKYQEANSSDLVNVDGHKLHKDAAKAFLAMQEAGLRGFVSDKTNKKVSARLTIISAFRSVEHQAGIVKRKEAAGQSPEQIYIVSSAPGHSEHHTGYALDINELTQGFENTHAYEFLVKRAKEFGFELSFSRGNHQGIAYEPWHWRFIGTPEAQKAFQLAQIEELKKNPKKDN